MEENATYPKFPGAFLPGAQDQMMAGNAERPIDGLPPRLLVQLNAVQLGSSDQFGKLHFNSTTRRQTIFFTLFLRTAFRF